MELVWQKVAPHIFRSNAKPSELWNQDWMLKTGEFVGLVAPSGTGKSTAISILALQNQDYQGSYLLDGKLASSADRTQIAAWQRETIAVVWQDLRLIPHISGKDNVLLRWQLNNSNTTPTAPTPQTLDHWADELGIAEVWHRPTQQLSQGERQRVAIMRALAGPFKFLFLDEPFSHLDPQNASKASNLIQQRCQAIGAAFLVTMLAEDQTLPCTRIIHL